MIMPVDPSAHRKRSYFLKLVSSKLQDWRWRFEALTDEDAIAMSTEQLCIIGDSKYVTGAILVYLEPEGSVLTPVPVRKFSVSQRTVVMEEEK